MNIKENQIVAMGFVLAIGTIISTAILTSGIISFQKLQNQKITVTGAASQNIKSDSATINFSFKAKSTTMKGGYQKISSSKEKVKQFLIKSGIEEKDINFGNVSSYEVYKKLYGNTTNEVEYYNYSMNVNATSKNIDTVKKLSDNLGDLVNQDIEIEYSNVEYLVSNLDEIKVKMIGEATKNAKERAKSMVKSSGNSIGTLSSAKMGVFQITPVNSTEVSDYGISDTSSVDKKITAVVNATFTVR